MTKELFVLSVNYYIDWERDEDGEIVVHCEDVTSDRVGVYDTEDEAKAAEKKFVEAHEADEDGNGPIEDTWVDAVPYFPTKRTRSVPSKKKVK